MQLQLKSIGLPQVWGEGSAATVELWMIKDDDIVGRMHIHIPYSDKFFSSTITDISDAAIAEAKRLLD